MGIFIQTLYGNNLLESRVKHKLYNCIFICNIINWRILPSIELHRTSLSNKPHKCRFITFQDDSMTLEVLFDKSCENCQVFPYFVQIQNQINRKTFLPTNLFNQKMCPKIPSNNRLLYYIVLGFKAHIVALVVVFVRDLVIKVCKHRFSFIDSRRVILWVV